MTKKSRIIFLCFAVLFVALVILRLILPQIILRYVNRTLGGIKDYHGQVENIDLSLWRGAYTIYDLRMLKRGGQKDIPFLHIPRIDLSIQWSSLFHGKLVSEIELTSPVLNLLKTSSQKTTQISPGAGWIEQGEKLFPFEINRLAIEDGTVAYMETDSMAKIDLRLTSINGEFQGITNRPQKAKPLPTTLWLEAHLFKTGNLRFLATAQIHNKPLDFKSSTEINNVALVNLNEFTRKHALFDFAKGTFSLYSEVSADKGQITGYAKPLFTEVQIVDVTDTDNPLETIWEGFVGGIKTIFTNQNTGNFATIIPIEGRVDDPDLKVWPTLYNIFINAFIKGFRPGLESKMKATPTEGATVP